MDEKQKESAMGFYEKHEKDFPKYCEVGLVSKIYLVDIIHLK